MPWSRFAAPWFYFIIVEFSRQSCRIILQYVCLDGRFLRCRFYGRVLRSVMPVSHSCCRVLHLAHARLTVSIAAFYVRLTPAVCRMCAKQDGLRYAAFLFRHGSESPLERSRMPSGYRALRVHFGIARFFMAIPTRARPEFAYTKRSAASGGRFFRYRSMIHHDTAGSTLGLKCGSRTAAAPDCGQRVKSGSRTAASLDSLHLIRGVGAFGVASTVRIRRVATRIHERPARL